MEKSTGRIVFLDYIRVLACLAVMMAHASEYFYCVSGTEAMVANEQNRFWVGTGPRRPATLALQFPYDGSTLVVYVPTYQPLSHHPRHFSLAERCLGTRRAEKVAAGGSNGKIILRIS